jgi:uncharacterized protein YbjT (DUF2867 family)
MMQHDKVILVTGATGKQGGSVARHLLRSGVRVRALTRNPSSEAAQRLASLGAELVAGSLNDRPALDRAVSGVYGVFSVQNYWEPGVGYEGEVRQGKNLADSAQQAGVRHFVQSSMATATSFDGVEHFASKQAIERYIAQLGLPSTSIGTVYFMDNLLDPKMGGSMTFPVLQGALKAHTPFHLMAADDIGAIATIVFQQPARFIGTKINVAGDVLTVQQMKAIYRQSTGKRPRPFAIPLWMLRLMNQEFAAQLAWHNQVGWSFGPDEARRVYPELTTFAQFLQQHRVTHL